MGKTTIKKTKVKKAATELRLRYELSKVREAYTKLHRGYINATENCKNFMDEIALKDRTIASLRGERNALLYEIKSQREEIKLRKNQIDKLISKL